MTSYLSGTIRPSQIGKLFNSRSLKDLLFRLPRAWQGKERELTGREWTILNMYLETPVEPAERARLVAELAETLRTEEDRELVLAALQELILADGLVTQDEQAVVEEIRAGLKGVDLGLMGRLARLIDGPMQRRSAAMAGAPNREEYLDDFIRNKVYYRLVQRLHREETGLDIPEADLRKLSLAGGMMARLAHVDRVTGAEQETIARILQQDWDLNADAAAFVTEVAVSATAARMDYYRLVREFTQVTSEDERVRFLDVLFDLAAADGFVSNGEIEEIRLMALHMTLRSNQFIDAKLKIPREKRAG